MAHRFRIGLLVALTLASVAPLLADGSQFGTLSGRIRDEQGGALPGVTVELASVEQGFHKNTTTDPAGAFTFPLLPPGRYSVKATLSGFENFEADNNVVTAEKTTALNVTLKLAREQAEVVVSGDVPLVDKTNVSDTTHVDSSLAEQVAIPRGYQTLIEFAPGVNDADGDGNTNSHGAIDSSNLFLFDGIDTTDPTTGTFGANNNFDTIQEVVVSNAAVSAEYGRAQGAIVNVISKSGTNVLHGSARIIVTNDDWNSQNKGSFNGSSFERTKLDKNVYDYLFTLGGPVWKDHVWFFGGYERNPQATPPQQTAISDVNPPPLTGQSYTQSRTFTAWQGKLNGQITPAHALVFQAQADPFTGIIRDYWALFGFGSAEKQALTAQDQSNDCPWACIWQVRYTGVYGTKLSAEAAYAQQRGGITVADKFGNGSPIFSAADNLFYNGNPFDGFVKRPRDQANLALSFYDQLFGHSHQVKVGVDYQKINSESSFAYPGNQSFFISGFDPATRTQLLQPGDQWLQFTTPRASVSNGKIYGIYALDRFEATNRLSFNLGVRIDVQKGSSDLGNSVISATTASPRLSGSYDIFGNGKTLASVSYGQYRDFLVQNIIDSIYAGVPQEANFDLFVWDGSAWQFAQSIRAGGNTQPVNTGLKPSKVDEFSLALQQQIGNTMAVGIRGIYRHWSGLIDDARFINADGVKITTPVNFDSDVLKRRYKGIELSFEKRFGKNWQLLANYTLSRATGNHESVFSSQLFDYAGDTCTVNPVRDSSGNIIVPAISGDCAQILGTNRNGILSYDVTHALKIFGAYTLSLPLVNLTAAPSLTFTSGLPIQAQRTISVHGDTDTYFYTRRGSSRLPNWYQLNFSLEGDLKVFGPIQAGLKADILNVTDQQTAIAQAGISLLPNSNFGLPTTRNSVQAPRTYQFQAVLRF